ncbi:MAG: hypothetical protein IJY25_02590 [Bacilli bacterium]|nr:hypothetical protein [Bacilli bacterium]
MKQQYEELMKNLINEFSKSIPVTEEEKDKLIWAFYEHLKSIVTYIYETNSEQDDNYNMMKRLLEQNARRLTLCDINSKKSILIKDEAFEKLEKLSFQLFEYAKEKKNNTNLRLTKDSYNEILEAFDKLYELVKPYNKEEAENLRSEGILDADYLFEDECNITSLRLGQTYK